MCVCVCCCFLLYVSLKIYIYYAFSWPCDVLSFNLLQTNSLQSIVSHLGKPFFFLFLLYVWMWSFWTLLPSFEFVCEVFFLLWIQMWSIVVVFHSAFTYLFENESKWKRNLLKCLRHMTLRRSTKSETYFHQLQRQVLEQPIEIADLFVACLVEDLWLDFLVGCHLDYDFADCCNCVCYGNCHCDNRHCCHRCCSRCFDSSYLNCGCYNNCRCFQVGHDCNCRNCNGIECVRKKSSKRNKQFMFHNDHLPATTCWRHTKCFAV